MNEILDEYMYNHLLFVVFLFFNFFHAIHFNNTVFPINSFHKLDLPSCPNSFSFCLIRTRQKNPNSTKNMQYVFFWPITPEHEVCHGVWPAPLHYGKKWIFPLSATISMNSFLARGGILCLLSLPRSQYLSGLDLGGF